MTQLTELKQEHQTRRRARGIGATVAAVAVAAAVVWVVVDGPRPQAEPPAGSPSPTAVDARQQVGSNLVPPISASAPSGWRVDCDCDYLWFSGPTQTSFQVSKQITLAIDPETGRITTAPSNYGSFMAQHPWVAVQYTTVEMVDGESTYSVTWRLRDDAEPAVAGGKLDLVTDGTAADFQDLEPGSTYTDVVLPLTDATSSTGYRLLRYSRDLSPDQVRTIQGAVAAFLATVDLP